MLISEAYLFLVYTAVSISKRLVKLSDNKLESADYYTLVNGLRLIPYSQVTSIIVAMLGEYLDKTIVPLDRIHCHSYWRRVPRPWCRTHWTDFSYVRTTDVLCTESVNHIEDVFCQNCSQLGANVGVTSTEACHSFINSCQFHGSHLLQ